MWATRVCANVRKTSTGLVGLKVNPNARNDLIKLYEKTLKEIQILPKEAYYRSAVEDITNYRLKTVKSTENEEEIETEINCGQLEELIEQAKDELKLIPYYYEHRLWEIDPKDVQENN